jgi:hypothetical protein
MTEFQKSIMTLIKPRSCEFSQQKFLSKDSLEMFDFKKLHKILEELFMHHISNVRSKSSILIELFKSEYFIDLEFV